jgi:hypothetical protein
LSALTDGEYDAFSPGTTDAMIPDHARKRLDAFLKVLKNAGLAEAGIARVHDLAVAYETDRGGPPLSQDEVLSWIKTRTFASEREQRGAEAFLGAYLVFNSPSSGADVSSLIQGLLSLEADTVIKAAHDALEGEGPLGRIATRTMSFLTRETVRQWLAPIGAIALVVLAFLENPAFIFMRMVHPTPTKASRELDMSDAAVKSARLEAELARPDARRGEALEGRSTPIARRPHRALRVALRVRADRGGIRARHRALAAQQQVGRVRDRPAGEG